MGAPRFLSSVSAVAFAPGTQAALGDLGTQSGLLRACDRIQGRGHPVVCISSPCRVHWPKKTSPVPKHTRMASEGEKSRGMLLPKRSWHLAPTAHPFLVSTRWRRSGRYLLPALDDRTSEKYRAMKPVSRPGCQRGSWVFLSAAQSAQPPPTSPFRSSDPFQAFLRPHLPSASFLRSHRLPLS